MKKLLFVIFAIGFSVPLLATQRWTPITKEQAEYSRLMSRCADIAEQYTAMGASGGAASAIFTYLKNIGTPVALRVLKAQIKSGRCPASYLNYI